MDIKTFLSQINKEGYIFIAAFALLAFILGQVWSPLGWIMFFLAIWTIYFFRDPIRSIPVADNIIVSPADGVVQKIAKVSLPKELGIKSSPVVRVSIFISVMDVHVNRSPIAGVIEKIHYHPGKFFNASLDKASEFKEKNYLVIKTDNGTRVAMAQIAGLIARRIVCFVKEKEEIGVGERVGIIRFGSRVDIYLPEGEAPLVNIGQTVVGGETIISQFGNKHKLEVIQK